MSAGIFIAIFAAGLVATLIDASAVHVPRRDIRVGDVAAVVGPRAEAVRSVVIARLPEGTALQVARADLARLIKRAVPGIEIDGDTSGALSLGSTAPSREIPIRQCFEAQATIAVGEPILDEDVRAVACDPARAAAAVVRDANRGMATAAAAIKAGDYLGQLLVSEPPIVQRGDTLTLVSSVGPVRITRDVTALQAVPPGQHRLFVRTKDGSVFAAPIAAGAAE